MHAVFSRVNRRRQWWQLPTASLKALNLLSQRLDLRDFNLFDAPGHQITTEGGEEPPPEALTARRTDGMWNDLKDPDMGAAGTEFGRNIDRRSTSPRSPRACTTQPARGLARAHDAGLLQAGRDAQSLAAAWIQFENHNWFFHGRGKAEEVMEVPLPRGDDAWPEDPMHVRRTVSVPAHQGGSGGSADGVYGNSGTHWWDGSQLYGASKNSQDAVRAFEGGQGSRSATTAGCSPTARGRRRPGRLQRELLVRALRLHTLFTKEHNAICKVFEREHPDWTDQRLFDTASSSTPRSWPRSIPSSGRRASSTSPRSGSACTSTGRGSGTVSTPSGLGDAELVAGSGLAQNHHGARSS